MTELWDSVASDLDTILRLAPSLDQHPAPDGLPPVGTWIRAVYLDDDARPQPETPWHWFAGWNGERGNFATRCCRQRPGSDLQAAMGRYLGEPARWPTRSRLEVALNRPRRRACRKCVVGLERDQVRQVEAARQARFAELAAALPAIEAIATDPGLDDAERGRRLREVWPLRPVGAS